MKDYLHKRKLFLFFILGLWPFIGCQSTLNRGAQVQQYLSPEPETEWIRDGEPIEFEGALWYPADGIESLLDSEVYLVGEYRGVQIFVDKLDVRPFGRLYTKFEKNKFRYFKRRE